MTAEKALHRAWARRVYSCPGGVTRNGERARFEPKRSVVVRPGFDDPTLEQQKAALAGFGHA